MSTYSASIYSQEEDGTPINTSSAPALPPPSSSRHRRAAGAPSSSRSPPPLPHFVFPAPSSALPPPPPSSAPPPPPLILAAPAAAPPPPPPPAPAGPGVFFVGGNLGMGMLKMSEVTLAADRVLSSVEKVTNTSKVVGSIKHGMMHKAPEFVGGLKELTEKVNEIAMAAREDDFFRGIAMFRVEASVMTTLKALQSMNAGLIDLIVEKKKMPKGFRETTIEQLGLLHFELELLGRALDAWLGRRMEEYNKVLDQVKTVRVALRAGDRVGESSKAKMEIEEQKL